MSATGITDLDDITQSLNELDNRINAIKEDIIEITEMLKVQYHKASLSMKENQNYFLSGIQTSPANKHYIITHRGIEVVADSQITSSISLFLDNVMQFADIRIRKIEVLKELYNHIKRINEMITADDDGDNKNNKLTNKEL
jgi:hypothetical protein